VAESEPIYTVRLVFDWLNIDIELQTSDVLALVAIAISSVGAYVSWKSHKRTLMLGMPTISPFLEVLSDDQGAVGLSIVNDGPRVNRLISHGLIFASVDYAPMDPESAGIKEPLAPGERVRISINLATYKARFVQSGEQEVVGAYVRDLDKQTYAEAIRPDPFSDPILSRKQVWQWRLLKVVFWPRNYWIRKSKEFIFLRGCLDGKSPSIFRLRRPNSPKEKNKQS